jgi:fatty acid desaturase
MYQARLATVWLTRTALLGMLGRASPLGLVVYIVAVIARIHVVRFVDSFQHSFPEVDPNLVMRPQGREFEQENTFTFPVAYRWTPLNLLILNFGFHNAHHAMPTCPWYSLPRLHQMLFDEPHTAGPLRRAAPPRAPFLALLRAYHRHRLTRLVAHDQGQAYDEQRAFSLERFSGAFTDKLLG